jgi:hypothetical protein
MQIPIGTSRERGQPEKTTTTLTRQEETLEFQEKTTTKKLHLYHSSSIFYTPSADL